MINEVDFLKFRDGIFALNTRRFGSVAEIMIKRLHKFDKGQNQFHDLYDNLQAKRLEVKFSTVRKKEDAIRENNVISAIFNANIAERSLESLDWSKTKFDCNIQQVKPAEFDVLYYGLFFTDKIAIFSQTSKQVVLCPGFSDKQHKGNQGEGQFHLNQRTFQYHLDNHLDRWLTYDELYNLLK